jgi:hypothetical protein
MCGIGWRIVSALAAFSLLFSASARHAQACATAPPEGATVAVAGESAIIVWDEATKTEHFIRRATFETSAKDFGFLVPTPTKPELAEASDDAFLQLEDVIRPEVVTRTELRGVDLMPLVLSTFLLRSTKTATPEVEASVRVLEQKRVGAYDATVLEADDARALAEWLKKHGYAQRPALEEWLAPYVAQKWKLTAFKIAEPASGDTTQVVAKSHALATDAVRMTFHTERPFFPYREPRDQRESMPNSPSASRSLRVFFFGPARAAGTIGERAAPFAGKTVWAAPAASAGASVPVAVPEGAWLTVVEDDASPRPGVDELWFGVAEDASIVKPPPVEHVAYKPVPIPLDVVAVMVTLGYFVVRTARRRRSPRLDA